MKTTPFSSTEETLKDQCKNYLKNGLELLDNLLKNDLIIKEKKTPVEVLETLKEQILDIRQRLKQNKLSIVKQKKCLNSIISHFAAIRHCLSLTIGKGKELFSKEEIYSPLSVFIKDGHAIIERYDKILPSISKKQKQAEANDARPSLLEDNLITEEKRNREQIFLHDHTPFQLLLTKIWQYAIKKERVSMKVFISYAWPKEGEKEKWTKEFVERLAAHLIWAGFQVFLDEFQSGQGYPLAPFMENIKNMDHVLVISTRSMGKKLQNQGGVWYEYLQIKACLENNDKLVKKRFVIPILLNNKNYSHGDFQKLAEVGICFEGYISSLQKLFCRLYKLGKFNYDKEFNASWEILKQSVNAFVQDSSQSTAKNSSDNNNQTLQLVTYFKQALKEEYLKQQTISSVFGKPLKISEAYVNLSLIDEKKNKDSTKKEEEKNTYRDGRISSFEDLFGEKRDIPFTDLFKPDEKTSLKPTRILVQGRAGIGKTFFIRFIFDKYMKGELWPNEYEWVFKIVLRRLTQDEYYQKLKLVQIKHIVFNECFNSSSMEDWKKFEIFWEEYIRKLLPSKMLFLLDGFDEIASIINNPKHPVNNALLSILKGNFPYILTSRPYGLSNLPQELEYRNVEIIGFTNDNIEKYIHGFFENSIEDSVSAEESANRLLMSIRKQSSVWCSAHIPLLLNFICGIYQDREMSQNPISMTNLYQQIEMKLLERAHKDNFPEDYEEILAGPADSCPQELHKRYQQLEQFLGWIAIESLQQETLLILPKLIDEALKAVITKNKDSLSYAELRKQNYQVGFLRPVYETHTQHKQDREQFYEFIHLTFQEYYAAKKIAHGLQQPTSNSQHQEAIRFIQENKWNPRYQIVFWFIAGLLKDDEKTFGIYLNLLQDKETCDLIGQYKLGLLMRVIDEGNNSTSAMQFEPIIKDLQKIIFDLYQRFLGSNLIYDSFFDFILNMLKISNSLLNASDEKSLCSLIPAPESEEESHMLLIFYIRCLELPLSGVLKYLNSLLKDKNWSVRSMALDFIQEFGPNAATPEILSNLTILLEDNELLQYDEQLLVVVDTILALQKLSVPPKVLKILYNLLETEDKNSYTYLHAAQRLLSLQTIVVPELNIIKILNLLRKKYYNKKDFTYLYSALMTAIKKLDKNDRKKNLIITTLNSWLENDQPSIDLDHYKLGEYVHIHYNCKKRSANIPKKITPQNNQKEAPSSEDVITFCHILKHSNWFGRSLALKVIRELVIELGKNTPDQVIIETLKELMGGWDRYSGFWTIVKDIAAVISALDSTARTQMVSTLKAMLNSKDFSTPYHAMFTIVELGNFAKSSEMLEALEALLQNEEADPFNRFFAAKIIIIEFEKITPQICAVLLNIFLKNIEASNRELDNLEFPMKVYGKATVISAFLKTLSTALIDKAGWNRKVINEFIRLGEKDFSILLKFWCDLRSPSEQILASLFALAIAHYKNSIPLQVLWNIKEKYYFCQLHADQSIFSLRITHQQAQWLRHLVPFIMAHLVKLMSYWGWRGDITPIKELLKKAEELPELTADPLLPEIMIKPALTKSPNPLTMPYNVEQSVFSKITSCSIVDNNNTSDPHIEEKYSP